MMQIFGIAAGKLLLIYLPELLFLISFVRLNILLREKDGSVVEKMIKVQFWARMLMAAIAVEIFDLLHWILPENAFRVIAVLGGCGVLYLMHSLVIVIQEKRMK